MRELVNAFGLLSINQVSAVLFGLVRSKLLAALLGPFGVGIVSQGTSLMQLIRQIASLGIGNGFLKLIAEAHGKDDNDQVNRIAITVFAAFGIFGAFIVVLSVYFRDQISVWVFDDFQYGWIIVIISVASWLFVQYGFLQKFFQGLQKWRQFVTVSVIGYAINIFITAALIYWFGIVGAVVSLLLAQVTNLIVGYIVLMRAVVIPDKLYFWRARPNRETLIKVMRFIGPLTTISFITMFSTVFIRSEIIRQMGLEGNGIYQVVRGISVTYMGVLTISMGTFGVSKISSILSDPDKITKIQNHQLRLSVFVIMPIVIGLLALRDIWIPLLYSSSFVVAGSFLIWQFGADFFRVIRQSLSITLVPKEKFTYLFFEGILYWVGWMLLVVIYLPKLGLVAIPMTFFIVNIFVVVISYVYQKRTMNFQLSDRNRILLTKAIPTLLVGLVSLQFAESTLLRIAIATAFAIILGFWVLTKSEYKDMMGLVLENLENLRDKRIEP